MSFVVSGEAYDVFMGRYSRVLAPAFADFAGVGSQGRLLDVGAGPGALTAELARRVGAEQVAAADPSPQFVAACRDRVPGADVRQAGAEELPWEDGAFDAVLSQLAVNFMRMPDVAATEMRRVARPGAVVAACTWARGEGLRMVHVYAESVGVLGDPFAEGGPVDRYRAADELERLWEAAGFAGVETAAIDVEAEYDSFDDFWAGFLTGTGPHSAHCASLSPDARAAVREECRRRLGSPGDSFTLPARAWAVRGTA